MKTTWVFNCSREKSETGEHDMGKVSNEGEGGESRASSPVTLTRREQVGQGGVLCLVQEPCHTRLCNKKKNLLTDPCSNAKAQ